MFLAFDAEGKKDEDYSILQGLSNQKILCAGLDR